MARPAPVNSARTAGSCGGNGGKGGSGATGQTGGRGGDAGLLGRGMGGIGTTGSLGVVGGTGATCLSRNAGIKSTLGGPLAQWPAVLPISSTVLPFQWNRTSVVKPLMAPGYVKATVSPLVCDASMPLNP